MQCRCSPGARHRVCLAQRAAWVCLFCFDVRGVVAWPTSTAATRNCMPRERNATRAFMEFEVAILRIDFLVNAANGGGGMGQLRHLSSRKVGVVKRMTRVRSHKRVNACIHAGATPRARPMCVVRRVHGSFAVDTPINIRCHAEQILKKTSFRILTPRSDAIWTDGGQICVRSGPKRNPNGR